MKHDGGGRLSKLNLNALRRMPASSIKSITNRKWIPAPPIQGRQPRGTHSAEVLVQPVVSICNEIPEKPVPLICDDGCQVEHVSQVAEGNND